MRCQVLVEDVAEAPVFLAAPTTAQLQEASLAPAPVVPTAWADATNGTHGTPTLAFGYILVVDAHAPNTSLVTLAVGPVTHVVSLEVDPQGGPGAMVPADTVSSHVWLTLVGPSLGQPCVGGLVCGLQVAPGAPVLDYDTGLRALVVQVIATGPTGLTTTVDVTVNVLAVNEGASTCWRPRC
jgi:hypothetical protein